MENLPEGYLVLPRESKGPGVLVLHAWWGLTPFFKDQCKRLARAGFAAYAPDLYHGKTAGSLDEAAALSENLPMQQAQADMDRSIAYLHGQPAVSGTRLGVIGFSLGAYLAFGLSRDHPAEIGAVVSYYGTYPASLENSRAVYLCHFAERDQFEPVENVKSLEDRLRTAGRPYTFHVYPGTGHWFFEKDRPEAYNASAARVSWQRSLAFLRNALGS